MIDPIPCTQCNAPYQYVFDEKMVLKLLWCKKCNNIDKPIGREKDIRPEHVKRHSD